MMKTTTEFKLVSVYKLVPYQNNARTHSPEQINKLRSSLREFGFINPIIIREQAEREKGCGFCCYQEHPDKTLYPKEGYAFYAGFSKQIDVDDFDEIEIDEIKYCPICSRRLEVEHE